MTTYDLAVVGAGPAGIAGAVTAAGGGLRVALVDAVARTGGQFHRHRTGGAPAAVRRVERFATVDHLGEHRVWAVQRVAGGFAVHALAGERSPSPVTIRSAALLIATGGYDRQLPFPGWELPGVFTAGGAQALLKGDGVIVGRRVVVAGSGPFLLPVATGLTRAGARVVGVYEASRPARFARHVRAVLGNAGTLWQAAGYQAALLRRRTSYRTGRAVVAAHGDGRLDAVTVAALDRSGRPRPGTERRVACDALAVGYGFTPQVELLLQLECAMRTDADGSLVAEVDDRQRTSQPGVYAAGEVTGVGGAVLAAVEGELAGLAVLADIGSTQDPAAPAQARRRRAVLARRRDALRRFALALYDVYRPPAGWPHRLDDDTLICRCEAIPAGRLRHAVQRLGATDARSAKLLTRVGMGRCQGRICQYAAACLTADAAGREVAATDLATLANRPLAQPGRWGCWPTCNRKPICDRNQRRSPDETVARGGRRDRVALHRRPARRPRPVRRARAVARGVGLRRRGPQRLARRVPGAQRRRARRGAHRGRRGARRVLGGARGRGVRGGGGAALDGAGGRGGRACGAAAAAERVPGRRAERGRPLRGGGEGGAAGGGVQQPVRHRGGPDAGAAGAAVRRGAHRRGEGVHRRCPAGVPDRRGRPGAGPADRQR